MRFSSLLVATLAALSSAAPIEADPAQNGTALEERNGDPPQATFFYDDQCRWAGDHISLRPDKYATGTPVGGPWGTRSALFTSTNGLIGWTIESGPKGHAKDKVVKPKVGQCVAFQNELYVTGDTSLTIHT